MTAKKGSAPNLIVALAAVGIILAPVLLTADAAAGKKGVFSLQQKGLLTTEQRANFKSQKSVFRKVQKVTKANIKQLSAPWSKAKREFEFATRQKNRSTLNLTALRKTLDQKLAVEQQAHNANQTNVVLGTPFTPSPALQRSLNAFARAEAFHKKGPAQRFDRVKTKFDPLNQQMTIERAGAKAASDALAKRSADKNAARETNFAAFKAAAKARRDARIAANAGPAPVVVGVSSQINPRFANQFGVLPAAPPINYSALPPAPANFTAQAGAMPGYTTVPPLAPGQN